MKSEIWNLKYRTNNNHSSSCAIGIIDNQLIRRSTSVENIRQIRLFLQNKPNFPHFSPENDDLTQKQTQYKPNSKPIQTQLLQMLKMTFFARKMSFTIVYCDFIVLFTTLKGVNIKGGKANSNPIKPKNHSSACVIGIIAYHFEGIQILPVIPLLTALIIDVYFQAAYNGK